MPENTQRLDAVSLVVNTFGNRTDLFEEYYSFDLVRSMEARAR
jgi:hypothetical protein